MKDYRALLMLLACYIYICQNNHMIYFIRHSQSLYNIAELELHKKLGNEYQKTEEYLHQKFDGKYFDVEITEKGIDQAEKAALEMAEKEVDLIIVSPLRRALRTCEIIFRNHPSKAPIVVFPYFREILQSANDIGTKIKQSSEIFKTFDFSNIIDKEAWYVHTIEDEAVRNHILSEIEALEGEERHKKAIQLTLQFMKQNWEERSQHPEKEKELKHQILSSYEKQTQMLKELLQKYKNIVVVAHSECIKQYAGYKINNCQIFPFPGQNL